MPVPESVPLAQRMMVPSEWYWSNRTPPGATRADPLRQGRRLIGLVHHAEGVDDQVPGPAVGDRLKTPVGQQAEPRASMGTGELGHRASTGEPPGRRQPFDGVRGLRDQRFGLGAARLLGHGGFADQLRQAACRAQPHLQRVRRVGSRVVGTRENGRRRAGRPDRAPVAGLALHTSDRRDCPPRSPLDRDAGQLGVTSTDRHDLTDRAALGTCDTSARAPGRLCTPRRHPPCHFSGPAQRIKAEARASFHIVRSRSDRGVMSSQCVCRLCGQRLTHTFVDLGMSPLCESYVSADAARPTRDLLPAARPPVLVLPPRAVAGVRVGRGDLLRLRLLLVVLRFLGGPRQAVRRLHDRAARLSLGDSLVTEVASNDGYLLQHFVAEGIPVLGIEPAKNVAEAAQSLGIPTVVQFLGATTGSDIAERSRTGRPGGREQRVRPRPRHPGLRGRPARSGQGHRAWSPWSSPTSSA